MIYIMFDVVFFLETKSRSYIKFCIYNIE